MFLNIKPCVASCYVCYFLLALCLHIWWNSICIVVGSIVVIHVLLATRCHTPSYVLITKYHSPRGSRTRSIYQPSKSFLPHSRLKIIPIPASINVWIETILDVFGIGDDIRRPRNMWYLCFSYGTQSATDREIVERVRAYGKGTSLKSPIIKKKKEVSHWAPSL